jgi:uncharacterized membrane protein YkoI
MKAPVFIVLSLAVLLVQSVIAEGQKVTAEQLPAAVWQTIQKQANGRQPTSITREETGGEVSYEVMLPAGGGIERSMTVGANGALLSFEVVLTETPAAVQKTIAAQLNGGTIDGIEKTQDDGEVAYDVDFTTKDGQERSFSVSDDGTLLSIQITLEDAPPAVQAAIKTASTDGKIGEIEKQFDDGVITYDVTFTNKAGAERTFTVSAEGKLTRLEITIAEATVAAQKTIRNRVGTGTLQRVMEIFGGNGTTYEVEGFTDGKPMAFKVGPKGKFLGKLD